MFSAAASGCNAGRKPPSCHIRSLAAVTDAGAIVYPPVPAFYARPATIEEMVDHTLGRVLDLFGIETGAVKRWEGIAEAMRAPD